jgi:limonene-1,2-epoxide hydrolase
MSAMDTPVPVPIADFLAAVARRDPAALESCLTADAAYHICVPAPPVVGRRAVVEVFARIFAETSACRWDVASHATVVGDGWERAYVERVDRFWFDGREAAIECLGVFELEAGLIREVRDYVDLATWRQRRTTATT